MRLIDADALIERTQHGAFLRRRDVDESPTVDAEPVRHGKWIEDDIFPGVFRCNRCRAGAPITFEHRRNELTNYCPQCGARMDGDGE